MSRIISFRKEIVLVSSLKYDQSQPLNENTQNNVNILYYSGDWEKSFFLHHGWRGHVAGIPEGKQGQADVVQEWKRVVVTRSLSRQTTGKNIFSFLFVLLNGK